MLTCSLWGAGSFLCEGQPAGCFECRFSYRHNFSGLGTKRKDRRRRKLMKSVNLLLSEWKSQTNYGPGSVIVSITGRGGPAWFTLISSQHSSFTLLLWSPCPVSHSLVLAHPVGGEDAPRANWQTIWLFSTAGALCQTMRTDEAGRKPQGRYV